MDNDEPILDDVVLTGDHYSSSQFADHSENIIESLVDNEYIEPCDLVSPLDKSNLVDESIASPIDFVENEEPPPFSSGEYFVEQPLPEREFSDEWEECDEDEPIIWWWRILTAMIAITLVAAVFYFLQKYRQKQTEFGESESKAESSSASKEQHLNGNASVGDNERDRNKSDDVTDNLVKREIISSNEISCEKGEQDAKYDKKIERDKEPAHKINEVPLQERQITEQLNAFEQDVKIFEKREEKQINAEHADEELSNDVRKQKVSEQNDEPIFEEVKHFIVEGNQIKPDGADKARGPSILNQSDDLLLMHEDRKDPVVGEKIIETENADKVMLSTSSEQNDKSHKGDNDIVADDTDKEIRGIVVDISEPSEVPATESDKKSIPTSTSKESELIEDQKADNELFTDDISKNIPTIVILGHSLEQQDEQEVKPGDIGGERLKEIEADTKITVQPNEITNNKPKIFEIQRKPEEYSSSEEYTNNSINEKRAAILNDSVGDEAAERDQQLLFREEKPEDTFEDEVNITFSLKNNDLQKSQGPHNAVVEGEYNFPTHETYRNDDQSEEVSVGDLPKFEIELYDEVDDSEPPEVGDDLREDGIEPKYDAEAEEAEEEEEESEEFGENTTAPEIESYEAMVEAEAELSEKEVEDVELEAEDDILDDLHVDVEQVENNEEARLTEDRRVIPVSSSPTDGQQPIFASSKEQNFSKPIFENGAARRENYDDELEEKYGGNSILEVIGAQSIEEVLMKMDTLDAVAEVMRMAGLESSNLIFGIDYTASNKYQGEMCFGGKSLHTIEVGLLNPYQQVITILGKTLAPFASSGFIAAYGFGDVKCSDISVFPLKALDFCHSFDEVLNVYTMVTPKIILSGPTNFAPLIYQSMEICKQVKDYHILVIVADGQVTNERATRRAIVDACKYPISIIVVGVGDGPWEMMRVFDDSLPKRPWDNFHFVEFHQIAGKADNPDLAFAVQSLLEIPDQYKKIKAMGLLNFADTD